MVFACTWCGALVHRTETAEAPRCLPCSTHWLRVLRYVPDVPLVPVPDGELPPVPTAWSRRFIFRTPDGQVAGESPPPAGAPPIERSA